MKPALHDYAIPAEAAAETVRIQWGDQPRKVVAIHEDDGWCQAEGLAGTFALEALEKTDAPTAPARRPRVEESSVPPKPPSAAMEALGEEVRKAFPEDMPKPRVKDERPGKLGPHQDALDQLHVGAEAPVLLRLVAAIYELWDRLQGVETACHRIDNNLTLLSLALGAEEMAARVRRVDGGLEQVHHMLSDLAEAEAGPVADRVMLETLNRRLEALHLTLNDLRGQLPQGGGGGGIRGAIRRGLRSLLDEPGRPTSPHQHQVELVDVPPNVPDGRSEPF